MLQALNLTKSYDTPRGPLPILDDISLTMAPGEAAAIVGPSGSGKSTLLYILGALEPPTSGSVLLNGKNPYELGEHELAGFRNKQIGFVFQDHCLLPQCSVLENVLIPTMVAESHDAYPQRAARLLEQVGLARRLDHRPAELSGGEKQRVAIARALICEPALVLCDEPTGNLDRKSAEGVAELLLAFNHARKNILLVVTHSLELAGRFPKRFELVDRALKPA